MLNWNQITSGMAIYDATGEKLGTLSGADAQGQYLQVQKGTLFTKDRFIPASAVSRITTDGIYLNLTKGALSAATFDQLPVATAGAAGMAAAQTAQSAAGRVADPNADIDVKAYEEQLTVGKRQREEGRVHLHKEVETVQQSVPVTTRHEQVSVEHVLVDDRDLDPNELADAFKEEDIDVTLMGEEAVMGKRTRLTDEVRLRKQVEEVQEQVTGTVRREHIVVDGDDKNPTNPPR
jgi:uncharacterized protein (TIGR02271 family)